MEEGENIFVIYLSTEDKINDFPNVYGYYCGKTYVKAKEIFPVTSLDKNDYTVKVYKTEKIAENAGRKISDKCAYVTSYKIERL